MKKIVEIVLHLIFWFGILVVFPYVNYYLVALKNGSLLDMTFLEFLVMTANVTDTLYFIGYLIGFYILYFSISYALNKKRIIRFFMYLIWSLEVGILMYLMANGTIQYVIFTSFFIIFSTAGIFAAVVKGIILWLLDVSEKRILQKRQLELKATTKILSA